MGIFLFVSTFVLKGLAFADESAQEIYNKGIDYAIHKDFVLAKKEFEKVRQLSPDWGQVESALRIVEDTLAKIIKYEATSRYFSGIAYVNRDFKNKEKISHLKTDYIKKAINSFTSALKIEPKFTMAYYYRGVSYIEVRQFDEAIRDFTTAIKFNPNFSQAYFSRGLAYHNGKRQHEQAMRDYTKAIEVTPSFIPAYRYRGEMYLSHMKDKSKACADFKKYCDLGRCYVYKYYKQVGDCP